MALAADESVEFNGLRISNALTEVEITTIRLIADGMTNAEIARALSKAEATVKTQVSKIVAKFGLERGDRALIVATAFRRGIIT